MSMCVCVYIHDIHIYIYIYIHTYIYIYVYVCIYVYMCICICIKIHMCVCMYAYALVCIYVLNMYYVYTASKSLCVCVCSYRYSNFTLIRRLGQEPAPRDVDEEELTRRKQVDKHFHYRVLLALVTSLIVGLEETLGFAEIPKRERLSRASRGFAKGHRFRSIRGRPCEADPPGEPEDSAASNIRYEANRVLGLGV